jgi:hypothetical protein
VVAVARAGGLDKLAGRVHPVFAMVFTILVYLSIGPCLAIPRTASTSFQMLVPLIGGGTGLQLAYSVLFFAAAFLVALRPEKLTDWLGRILCPCLIVLIVVLFAGCLIHPLAAHYGTPSAEYAALPAVQGILYGYQTMDTLAGLNFGAVIALNIRARGVTESRAVEGGTIRAGFIAGGLLLVVYAMLGHAGALTGAAVPGLAEGHVHPDRSQHKADDDDHRPGHDGRQQAHDDLRAAPTDDEAQHHIDGTGHDHAAQRRGKPPSLHAIDDRRNEREGRREENGHLAACANLKNQRAHAGRKQGHVGAHARQDRHQHQRAECHKKHLRTEQGIFQPKRIRRIRLHLHSSEKNVCSLSSGGSRIPGLRGTAPPRRIGGSASPPARYRVPKMRSPASPRPGMM